MRNDKLIDGGAGCHQDGKARALPAAGTARLLPGAGNGAGITAQHAGRQAADIDTQLQGVGGDHRIHPAAAESLLDLPALFRLQRGDYFASAAETSLSRLVSTSTWTRLLAKTMVEMRLRTSISDTRMVSFSTLRRMPSCRLTTGGL